MKQSVLVFCAIVVLLVIARFHLNAATVESLSIGKLHKINGVPVTVSYPQLQSLSRIIHPTGNIKETKSIRAGFEVNGRLKKLYCSVGQYIRNGAKIAELDTNSQEALVSASRAALEIAEAILKKAVKGPRDEDIKSAKEALTGNNATFQLAKDELIRVKRLVEKGAAPQRQLDQANSAYKNAISAQDMAKTRLSLLIAGTREEDILAAKGRVLLARAQLRSANINLEKHFLTAPFSGIISSVPVEEGDVIKSVPTAKTIAEILQVTPILFECSVSELFIPYITKTSHATITIDAFPGVKYNGIFYEMVPKGNLTDRTFTVRFSVKNSDRLLKPGMFGRSSITLAQLNNVLTVPIKILREPSSIEEIDGNEVHFSVSNSYRTSSVNDKTDDSDMEPSYKAVMISINGVSAAILVQPGFISGNLVEIKSGLTKADLIITEGYAELKTGVKLDSTTSHSTIPYSEQSNKKGL